MAKINHSFERDFQAGWVVTTLLEGKMNLNLKKKKETKRELASQEEILQWSYRDKNLKTIYSSLV